MTKPSYGSVLTCIVVTSISSIRKIALMRFLRMLERVFYLTSA